MDDAYSLFRNCFCSEMQMISEGRHYVQKVFLDSAVSFSVIFPSSSLHVPILSVWGLNPETR